jgi:DNA-binding winged helix-turn-helix (wHTH) protein/TolB-like protein/Tfp pilus assembly protein PilF
MATPALHGIRRVYEFGEYRLDTAAGELRSRADGRPVELTARVYDTLLVLVEHAGELLDKRTLISAVWPGLVVEDNNLDQCISALRQALGERRGENRYIVTVRGRGYRFAAPVASVEPSAEIAAPLQSAPAEAAPRAVAGARKDGRRPLGAALAIVAAGALGVAMVVAVAPKLRPASEPQAPVDSTSLAVLPFRPLAVADNNESLELGMTETLISGLNSGRLEVKPLSSVRRYAGVEQDALLAGRALGVAHVLEGYLQRDGEFLRVSARLLATANGRQVWAERYDQRFTDIFSVQDAIAARVRTALTSELAGPQPVALRRYTDDAEAYQLYVTGRFHRQRSTEPGLIQALAYFEQAIERDPSFASAYVGLAETHSVFGVFGIVAPHEAFPRARAAVDKALELAPDLGEAYASLGHIKTQYEHDWAGAERALRRGVELDPSYAPAQQWLGLYLAYAGRFDEALARLAQAQALEPSAPVYSALIGMVLSYAGRHDEAIAQLHATLEMDARLPTAHTYLALASLRSGRLEDAARALDRIESPTPGSMAYRGQLYALLERREDALAEVARLVELGKTRYVSAYDVASIYGMLGDADEAFAWLERAFDDRSQLLGWLPWDEAFDGIRDDARYNSLLSRLNVAAR